MWLVLQVIEKGTVDLFGHKINLKDESKGILGMCPVFKTKKQAKKEYPNAMLIKVGRVKTGGER